MKKHFTNTALTLLFSIITIHTFGQTLIRDRWDTLYANVDYANTTNYLYQLGNLKVGNDLVIISDSIDPLGSASYFQYFNTTNSSLATVNYNRLYSEGGAAGCAAITHTSSGINYVFFGSRNTSSTSTQFGLYKYNSSTNSITSETATLPSNIHVGVANIGFFSPSTNNDSLSIFVNARLSADDSVYVYRKQYAQSGFVNTGIKLPIKLDVITKVFVFNNEQYIAGYQYPDNGKLLKSSDGINFNVISNYETNYPNKFIVDATILNNNIYLGLSSSSSGYLILESPNGNSFTTIVNNTGAWALSSLLSYQNTIWYSYYQFFGNKQSNSNANTNVMAYDAPYVGYLENLSNYNEILSIDTLGRSNNYGTNFSLQKVNSKLFLAGHYYNSPNANTPGTFVYQFIPPVANFTLNSTNLCMNTAYSFSNQSVNADSVRWYIDNNFYASTNNLFSYSFSVGSHTIGLIAISGTQKDSIQYAVNIYSVTVNMNNSLLGCMNNSITITPTTPGAIGPITYTWSASAALTQTSLSNPNLVVSSNAAGTYTYMLTVTDVNGCGAYSAVGNLTINPNKDLNGAVTVASSPLTSGNVILYKYEPVLTKFDSITYQPLNASGAFTFALQDAHTYILKCEPNASTLMITYAPSETSWKTAIIVTHGCVNGTSQNINVIPLTNIGTGPGMLSGKITEGQKYGGKGTVAPGNPIGGLTIKGGKNPGGNIVAQGRTNAAGEYTLSNLPTSIAGESYFVLVDVPGLDTNTTYHRAITTTSLQYTDLDFIVDSAKINPTLMYAGLKQMAIEKDLVRIFPNPTSGALNIQFVLDKPQVVEIRVHDITGKVIKTIMPLTQCLNNELKLQTQLHDLKTGVYLIKVRIGEAERTTRIVITN